jgi:hypothetical protein
MQHEAAEPVGAAMLDRFIKQAEAPIPEGLKGVNQWEQTGNLSPPHAVAAPAAPL